MKDENLYEQIAPLMDFDVMQRRWFEERYKPIAKKYCISLTDMSIMLVIHLNKQVVTARDVEKYSGLKRGIISVGVERLSMKKMLRQLPMEGDRRLKKLELTETSKPLLDECNALIDEYARIVFKTVNCEDLKVCCRVFEAMKTELGKVSESIAEGDGSGEEGE